MDSAWLSIGLWGLMLVMSVFYLAKN